MPQYSDYRRGGLYRWAVHPDQSERYNRERRDVITEPSLVYFGYTFCPDVCPLDSARNAEAVDLLAKRGMSATPVFISVDPKRDTPEVVAEFTKWLHPKMIGLTGTPEQVKAASQAYRTYYKAHDDKDDEYYLVDHSTMTYLMLPEHGFVEFFRRDQSAEAVAETQHVSFLGHNRHFKLKLKAQKALNLFPFVY